MSCSKCGSEMLQLFSSSVCKAECDLKVIRDTLALDIPEFWYHPTDGYAVGGRITVLSKVDIWTKQKLNTVRWKIVSGEFEIKRDTDAVMEDWCWILRKTGAGPVILEKV